MRWTKLLESATESLNDHLRLRNDYLMAENRILRNQMDGRVQLTDSARKELAEIGAQLGKKALAEIATVAQPETILAWNRQFAHPKVDPCKSPKSVGRPRVDKAIEDWVLRMARENRSWGYDRMQGSLKHLGYTISDQTVGNILKRHGISPAPERKKTVTWCEFTRSHWDVFVATGFFNSEVWNGFRLVMLYLLHFFHVSGHHIQSMMMALHQQMLATRALVRRALAISLRRRRWADRGTELSRESRVSDRVLELTEFEVVLAEARPLRSQDQGKVIPLSAARPRPIRDGPLAHRQELGESMRSDRREAA